MDLFTHMLQLLSPMKLYDLREQSHVYRELAVYAQELQGLADQLETIESTAFPSLGQVDTIALWETLLEMVPNPQLPLEQRRQMVLYRLGTSPNGFFQQALEQAVLSAGLQATLEEDPQTETLYVRATGYTNDLQAPDVITRKVLEILPAHLQIQLEIGQLTWNQFDGADFTWDTIDGLDLTWDEFSLHGHEYYIKEQQT